eukprot:jgi/Orpsp1_1/1189253/evm.model.d7180000070613.1
MNNDDTSNSFIDTESQNYRSTSNFWKTLDKKNKINTENQYHQRSLSANNDFVNHSNNHRRVYSMNSHNKENSIRINENINNNNVKEKKHDSNYKHNNIKQNNDDDSDNENEKDEIYDYADIKDSINDFKKDLGKVNILIAGKTGTGKSTLINAIFHENLAEARNGKPVSQETKEYTKEGLPISIIDTKGLEIADYDNIINSLSEYIKVRNETPEIHKHIHVAWICIAEGSSRVEDAEKKLIEMLIKFEIPVIVVITKTLYDVHFIDVVKELCPNANGYINVRAIEMKVEDHIYEPKNLDKLVKLTNSIIPKGINNALVASQKILLNLKNEASDKIVKNFIEKIKKSYGMNMKLLIPFRDYKYIISLEIKMITAISGIFSLTLEENFIRSIVKTIFGDKNALKSKGIISNLLKLIPGIGIFGAKLSSKYLIDLINIVGNIYINALYLEFTRKEGEFPTEEEIIRAIEEEKKKIN